MLTPAIGNLFKQTLFITVCFQLPGKYLASMRLGLMLIRAVPEPCQYPAYIRKKYAYYPCPIARIAQ